MPFHILTHNLTQGPKKRKNYMEEKGNTSPQKLQQHQEQTLDFLEAPMCWLSQATHSFSDKQTNPIHFNPIQLNLIPKPLNSHFH